VSRASEFSLWVVDKNRRVVKKFRGIEGVQHLTGDEGAQLVIRAARMVHIILVGIDTGVLDRHRTPHLTGWL